MKIFVLTRADSQNGSTRVRALQFVKYWTAAGHSVKILQRETRSGFVFKFLFLIRMIQLGIWSDVVFLQKPNLSVRLLKLLHYLQSNMVTDFDDAVWEQPLAKKGISSGAIEIEFGKRLKAAIKMSKATIAGSLYLANWATKQVPGANLFVVPPSVEMEVYLARENRLGKDRCVVIWIGSYGNLIDLEPIREVLYTLHEKGKINFVIVCDALTSKFSWASFIKWSEEIEVEALQKADIGIMPLNDELRSWGRCGYKAIQYMAASLPVISSPVGGGIEVVLNNVNGMIVTNPIEWDFALNRLLIEQDLRLSLGLRGKEIACEKFNTRINADVLLKIFCAK